jgi:large subunit ribosomal protein L23
MYNVIRRPIVTEKSTAMKQFENQVVFEVDRRANKYEIREAVERLFEVKVADVRTARMPGKPKRFGRTIGRRSSWKTAIVQLAEGEELDFFEGAAIDEPVEEEEWDDDDDDDDEDDD